MCKSEYPYEDGAIYLVRTFEGGDTELAQWNSLHRSFLFFGFDQGIAPEGLSQIIARIEYSLRPI